MIITGAAGQLGTAFRRVLPQAVFLTRRELDLTDTARIGTVLGASTPTAIINCAAFTAVDEAESNEDLAYTVNAEAVGRLAAFAQRLEIPFVTFSTDYVFDGESGQPYVESDLPNPINAYGRTKLAGEKLAFENCPSALVIRSSWVISGTHSNFVATMLGLVQARELTVVDDQWGRPTVADDLAAATVAALEEGVTGILHLTNQGATTWYELARTAVGLAGLDQDRIKPCSTEDFPTPALRPAYSVLASERLGELGLAPLPEWRDSLPSVVERLSGS